MAAAAEGRWPRFDGQERHQETQQLSVLIIDFYYDNERNNSVFILRFLHT